MRRGIIFAVAATIGFYCYAQDEDGLDLPTKAEILTSLLHSSVRIDNHQADIFSGRAEKGHGSGFIVEIDNDVARVFTNKHVIAIDKFEVQKVDLYLTTDTEVPEQVTGQVVYVSPIHDFAIIEIKLSKLKRTQQSIQTALLPSSNDYRGHFSKNDMRFQTMEVAAYGFPFEGSNITTFGQINGAERDSRHGLLIRTQTPINPGNSGGPLVDMTDGTVLGINTLKRVSEDSDNVGYAIPIGPLMEEYEGWKADRKKYKKNTALIIPTLASPESLETEGLKPIIEKVIPNYFIHVKDGVIRVQSATEGSQFHPGDLILAVNGQPVTASFYDFRKILSTAQGSAEAVIIRDRQVLKLTFPVSNEFVSQRRSKVDFVYLSGIIFSEHTPLETFLINKSLRSRVYFHTTLSTVETNFNINKYPVPGSVLKAIKINNKNYTIDRLLDLKFALNGNDDATFVKLFVAPVKLMMTEEGPTVMYDPSTGMPMIESHTQEFLVPITEVITPAQLSLARFAKQYGFRLQDFETRDWRRFVKPLPKSICEALISANDSK